MITSHIIFSLISSAAICQNCGDSYKLKLPMAISELGRRIDAFIVLHADCVEQEQVKFDIPAQEINRA